MERGDDFDRAAALVAQLARTLHAEVVETHISWVLLGEREAWKLKKPVRFGPVDYLAPAARRRSCDEELRVNTRLAPHLYLGVVELADGETREPAVHMRRFPDGALFSERLQAGALAATDVDALADRLARFHLDAPKAAVDSPYATAAMRREAALAVLANAKPLATRAEFERLQVWIAAEAARLEPLWSMRRGEGFVREGHGDLHLANVLGFEGNVVAFDAIEFEPALRWIDIVDDVAFAIMDFAARGRRDFALRCFNRWLEHTGDLGGVATLRFSLVYRALVRAQVEAARGRGGEARGYVDAALGWIEPAPKKLAITHGLPGSGKTFRSQQWLQAEGALRLRSDVERKRLFGLAALADSHAQGVDIYGADATRRTYGLLFETAARWLAAGWPVVIDAAFLRRGERDAAREVARSAGASLVILDCEAPDDVLRARLRSRRGDASEADERLLEVLRANAQPLGADELAL